MTSRNSSWKSDFAAGASGSEAEEIKRTTEFGNRRGPIPLLPAGKDYLWGGRRLRDDFSKDIPLTPLAETWECSTHPDGLSLLAEDPGKTLHELLQENPWMFGTHPAKSMPEAVEKGELPVLIKFIDAAADLSVQVHPDDAYAREHENGQLGKSEMWYVVDAAPGAKLVYGFSHDMDRERVREAAQNGTLEKHLQRVPIRKDDVFFIPAGTVHAIGGGSLIAEVQESSNLTYRLYDYHRIGKDGKERPLHLEKALQVARLSAAEEPRQPMRVLNYRPGFASEFLCRCRYFEVRRLLLNTQRIRKMASFQTDDTSFHVLICTDGCGVISCNRSRMPFFRGDTFFVPAGSDEIRIHGIATLLDVNC